MRDKTDMPTMKASRMLQGLRTKAKNLHIVSATPGLYMVVCACDCVYIVVCAR